MPSKSSKRVLTFFFFPFPFFLKLSLPSSKHKIIRGVTRMRMQNATGKVYFMYCLPASQVVPRSLQVTMLLVLVN